MLQLTVTNTIRDLPDEEWDALAKNDILSSYGWLRTVEETYTGGMAPVYCAARRNGRLTAATVAYRFDHPEAYVNLDNALFGRQAPLARKLRLSFRPVLECAPFRNYGAHILTDSRLDADQRYHATREVLSAIEKHASSHRMALCFSRVMDDERQLVDLLNQRGYRHTLTFPTNYLDVKWNDFDGYLRFIREQSINRKNNITKEINRLKRAGVVVEEKKRIGEAERRLLELLDMNYRKYNQYPLPFGDGFLSKLKDRLGDELAVYITRKQGHITGVSLFFRRGSEAWMAMAGVDYDLSRNDGTFFNLAFYHPIKEATRDGVKRIHWGNSQYLTKQRRGCVTRPCYIYYKSFNPIRNFLAAVYFPIHRNWFQKKLAPYNTEDAVPPQTGE